MAPNRETRTCKRGHRVWADNVDSDGQCRACRRIRQAWKGGLPNGMKIRCPKGHAYTERNTYVYAVDGRAVRSCRECKIDRQKRYYYEVVRPARHPGRPGRPRRRRAA